MAVGLEPGTLGPRPDHEQIADRLTEMIALVDVMERAELISHVPGGGEARVLHEEACALLLLLKRQMTELRSAVADPVDGTPATEAKL